MKINDRMKHYFISVNFVAVFGRYVEAVFTFKPKHVYNKHVSTKHVSPEHACYCIVHIRCQFQTRFIPGV